MEGDGWFAGHSLPPEPYRAIQFETFWHDRLWFEAHPGASEHRREYVVGEFWPHDKDVDGAAIEHVSIRMANFLGEDRGPLRMWSVHPPVLFGGADAEDAVNWKVKARDEGIPEDGPCPRCGTPAGVLFVEDGLHGSSFWLRCPECQGMTSIAPAEPA